MLRFTSPGKDQILKCGFYRMHSFRTIGKLEHWKVGSVGTLEVRTACSRHIQFVLTIVEFGASQ